MEQAPNEASVEKAMLRYVGTDVIEDGEDRCWEQKPHDVRKKCDICKMR